MMRIEQELVKSGSEVWRAAFNGLMALKIQRRLHSTRFEVANTAAKSKAFQEFPQPQQKVFKPPARQNPIFCFSEHDVYWSYRNQLEVIYQQYCPKKVNQIPRLMDRYCGREEYLLRKVCEKHVPQHINSPQQSCP
jgi:hypothetical protein